MDKSAAHQLVRLFSIMKQSRLEQPQNTFKRSVMFITGKGAGRNIKSNTGKSLISSSIKCLLVSIKISTVA
jgi:hypothetical protein